MSRIQIEAGVRNVQQETYKGHLIEVVAGYYIVSDRYPYHVYVTGPTGIRNKIDLQGDAAALETAFDFAFREAKKLLDEQTD